MSQLSKNSLFNFFAGHASPLQQKLIAEWMQQDNNIELYYEWLEEWEREHPQYLPDTGEALQHYLARIHSGENVRIPPASQPVSGKSSGRVWLKFAAAVTILLVSAFILYSSYDFLKYKSYRTDFGELRTVVLGDGSRVTLNANSLLRIPRFGFGEISRQVFLEGEAEFIVEHTIDNKKFLVRTPDNLEVEVVGTEFIVFSRDRGSKVVLNKGKVLLRSLRDKHRSLAVKPGDVVTIKNGVFDVKAKQQVQLHSAWKDHRFVFDRSSLTEIAAQLEERLDLKLIIQDSMLANRELTGTLEAENAEEILDILTKILDVKITRHGKNVVVETRQ